MEFSQGAGFKLFGKFISITPIQPPDHDPNLELQLTLPSIPYHQSQQEEKKEDNNNNNNNQPRKPTVIKRLAIKLNGNWYRLISNPRLNRVLQRMKLSSNHRLTHFFTRTLFESDVSKGQARLTIPHNRILRRFLNDDEERLLQQAPADKDGRRNGLRVNVIDPKLEVRALNLTRWNYAKKASASSSSCSCSYNYVLNGGWNELVDGNRLSKEDVIHVWSFRRIDESLGFIIFKE